MTINVVIVDYGLGNLLSVARAFKHCGADIQLTSSAKEIANADRLVLPGVGAFAVGMAELNSRRLIEPLIEFSRKSRPFLGICLGMQMMLEKSEEFGIHPGLGLIPGMVSKVPKINKKGEHLKVPHIGWNNLLMPKRNGWDGTILKTTQIGSAVYFVHSYSAIPTNSHHYLAECDYNGVKICSVLKHETLYGCQFHPEKSGEVGLKIIREFLRL